jgi:hypothetical protein
MQGKGIDHLFNIPVTHWECTPGFHAKKAKSAKAAARRNPSNLRPFFPPLRVIKTSMIIHFGI